MRKNRYRYRQSFYGEEYYPVQELPVYPSPDYFDPKVCALFQSPLRREARTVSSHPAIPKELLLQFWVFNRSNSNTIFGLLLDITPDGAQILTNKSHPFDAEDYHLVIHTNENPSQELLSADVHLCWTQPEGSFYLRNAFSFADQGLMQSLLLAHDHGKHWLRCELLQR